jgi:hypothetical protein
VFRVSGWGLRAGDGVSAGKLQPQRRASLNFDLEHTNYDNVIVRMAPRKESRYHFQPTYTPRPWAILGGSIRVTANVGYSITSVDGSTPQFNILQPLGSLLYKYQQPVANLSADLGHV